jgi:hypothetical protein
MRPYKQIHEQACIYREFTQDVLQEQLVWHRDITDREVEVLQPTDWMLQFDNEIPQQLKNTIFIPKGVYHRIIKGTGDLYLRIVEF